MERQNNELRDELIKAISEYQNNIQNKIRKEVKNELNSNLEKFEKIKMSQQNAKLFLKYIKVLENEKIKFGKWEKIVKETDLSPMEVEILTLIARCYRIYRKIINAKGEILQHL